MTIAVITGASSGLGRAFTQRLSREEDLDEIWAVARRAHRLEGLQDLCACPVRPIPLDLKEESSLEILRDMLEKERPAISILICAAGYGVMGDTVEIDPADNAGMVDLNCKAAVAVTLMCRPYLRSGSRVLEISSAAAFCPVPGVNVYAATKAFLESFAKGIHQEWKRDGISVTAVCPYWTKDTEFIPRAQAGKPGSWHSFPLATSTEQVVTRALRDSCRNRWLSTPGAVSSAAKVGTKFLPDGLLVPFLDRMRGKK